MMTPSGKSDPEWDKEGTPGRAAWCRASGLKPDEHRKVSHTLTPAEAAGPASRDAAQRAGPESGRGRRQRQEDQNTEEGERTGKHTG